MEQQGGTGRAGGMLGRARQGGVCSIRTWLWQVCCSRVYLLHSTDNAIKVLEFEVVREGQLSSICR